MQAKKLNCSDIYSQNTSFKAFEESLSKHDPNSNHQGFNGLHIAGNFPQIETKKRITLLLESGTDVNSIDHTGTFKNTPLHVFIANEATDISIFFLQEIQRLGVKVDYDIGDIEGKTSLILAAKTRNEKVALHILKVANPINLDKADSCGMTALHYACALGLPNLAKDLLQRGAKTSIKDQKGKIPIDYTAISKQEIEAILKSVEINPIRDEFALSNNIIDHNRQAIITINSASNALNPPLNCPSIKSSLPILKKSLAETVIDTTLISDLARQNPKPSNAFQILKNRGLDANAKKQILKQVKNMSGKSITDAAQSKQSQLRVILIEAGSDYSWLLRYFAANNSPELTSLLLLPDVKNYIDVPGMPSGKTALHQAALRGNKKICEQLIDAQANLNSQDAQANTPIMSAALAKQTDIVLLLAEKGADLSIQNNQRIDLFVILEQSNQVDLMDKLLSSKAHKMSVV